MDRLLKTLAALAAALALPALASGMSIFPSNATVELGTTVPFLCDNGGSASCTFSLVSGVGSITPGGAYTAPNSAGTAVVKAVSGSSSITASITVGGSIPTYSCKYGLKGANINMCTMQHTEYAGGTLTRKYGVIIPNNYVAGQSALIVKMGGTTHGIASDCQFQAGSENGGWPAYILTVPSPAPVMICPEFLFDTGGPDNGERPNTWGTHHWNWLPAGAIPNDIDFLRQIVLATVKDLNLDPRKVFITNDWININSTIAEEFAAENGDLVAAVGTYNDGTAFRVTKGWVDTTGIQIPNPVAPVSLLMINSQLNTTLGKVHSLCSNNLNHPVDTDDIIGFWSTVDKPTSFSYGDQNGSNTKFCTGTYDPNGYGVPTTLEKKIASGGVAGTEIQGWRLMGNARGTPWCSFDWNGNDTFCTSISGPAMDFRPTKSNSCTWQAPCNHYMTATTGYDILGLTYKFFLNHPKGGTGTTPPPPPDTTPPTVAISAPANGSTVSGTITVSGTAADNVALSQVELSVDGGAYAPASGLASWSFSLNTTSLSNASHSLTARATDTSGNTKTASINVTVNNSAPPPIAVTISPTNATVASGGAQQFTATVTGSTNTAVTFSATKGSISASGLLTTPAVTSNTTLTVTATSKADTSKSASAAVTVTAGGGDTTPPTASITSPVNGSTVSNTITVSGTATDNVAVASVQFLVDGGNLGAADTSAPYSASFDTTLFPNGNHVLTAVATDTSGNSASAASVTVNVNNAAPPSAADNRYCGPGDVAKFGLKDGPANLPSSCIYTALAGTPSPGKVIPLASGGNIAAAVSSANCGDTISLAAGGTFGPATLPAKGCDAGHWITIRTSASNSQLPPEGTRINPCYAGVASLPGRPAYSCPSVTNVMAKIVSAGPHAIDFASGAAYYRFIGLEITRAPGVSAFNHTLTAGAGAHHVIYDRVWAHGDTATDPTTGIIDETQNGFQLADSHHVALIDSYATDFHCNASPNKGSCTDAHAVGGGNDTTKGFAGTYKIVNNFLEASGENVMMGGGASVDTAGDLEVRRNHLYKPMIWNPSAPGYIGMPFIVKNSFELKNAIRVLFEGNIMENVWGGFSQFGAFVLLNPKNQSGGPGVNLCPNCMVFDITMRYSHGISAGQTFQLSDVPNSSGAWAKDGYGWSLHDILFENLHYANCQGCASNVTQIGQGLNPPSPSNILHDVTISHVTAVNSLQASGPLSLSAPMAGSGYAQPYNMHFDNSIYDAGKYGVWSTGGTSNCATAPVGPKPKLDACWASYTFTGNVLPEGNSIGNPIWPAGNFFPVDQNGVGYVNFNNGFGGDYHLAANSAYKGKATDGKDPGADIDCINLVVAGGNVSSCGSAPPPVTVAVSPSAATVASGGTQQFTAIVTGASNTAVTWSASKGSISSTGLFTAPTTTVTITAVVTATSQADTSKSASAVVTITGSGAPPPITVTLSPNPASVASGATLQFTATVTGSTNTAVTFSATKGSISASGLLTAPTVASNTTLTVTVTSKADPSKSASATVTVTAPIDTTPPTVSITAPTNGATVSGTITLRARASDNVGVASVQFWIDGTTFGPALTAPPYTRAWDTTTVAEGGHFIKAVALDAAGNRTVSAQANVTVKRTVAPTAAIPGLRNSYAYPNPALGGQTPVIRASLGVVDSVEITIYDQSGRAVHDATLPSTPAGTDSSGNYYYEYAWTGPIPSGLYYYVVHGKASDGTVVRGRGGIAVVR